jgi:hypothetical protein
MLSCTPIRHLVLVLAIPLLSLGIARAQRLEDGEVEFNRSKKVRDGRRLANQLFKGDLRADANDKTHQEAVDIAAKETVYSLKWFSDSRNIERGKINKVVEAFTGDLNRMSKFNSKTAEMQQLFCRQVMDRVPEVVQKGKVIAGVNAAMLLYRMVERREERGSVQSEKTWVEEVMPRLADGNGEHLANVVLALLKEQDARADDKQGSKGRENQGVRYYLYKTAASLLGLPVKTPLLKKETEDRLVQAALDFVEKPRPFPRNTPIEEVDGYRALRREAIRVLAAAPSATVGDKGKPALALARIAVGDESVKPPPHVTERAEAAIGLARLVARNAGKGDLQADYAAAAIARGVHAFAINANANYEKKGLSRSRPWKVDAARLFEAIDALKGSKDAYVNNAVKQCLSVLEQVERNNNAPAAALGEWLATNAPASKSLYRGDEATTVKPVEVVEK